MTPTTAKDSFLSQITNIIVHEAEDDGGVIIVKTAIQRCHCCAREGIDAVVIIPGRLEKCIFSNW